MRLIAAALAVSVAERAVADGVLRDAIGSISAGRAGANLARADNGAVLHDNPAGILNGQGSTLFELRADSYLFEIDYQDADNDEEETLPLAILTEGTYVRRSEDRRWAFGLGVFVPGGFGSDYHFDNSDLGRSKYESYAALIKVLPAVAYRPREDLTIGATLGVAWTRVQFDAPYYVQTGALAGTPTRVDLSADGLAPTWSVGIQYDWGKTRIGLSYLSATRLDLDGDVDVKVFGPGGVVAQSDFDLDIDWHWPQSLGIGITRGFGTHHRVTGDVVWFDWSNAFDQFELNFSSASNPAFSGVRGDVFPLRWRDSVSFRLGYEYSGFSWGTLRLGYAFHDNPIPSSTLSPLVPGFFEHLIALGASRSWGEWTWSAAFQLSIAPSQRVRSSAIVGGDYDGSKMSGIMYGAFVSVTYQGDPSD